MARIAAISILLLAVISSCDRAPNSGSSKAGASAAASVPESTTPLALAQRYAALINEGKAREAIEQTYDFKALADRAFAAAQPPISAAERDQIASMFQDMMTAPFVDPTMAPMMRSARFGGYDVQPGNEGLTIVSFTVHYEPPDGPRMSNALYFAPSSGTYKAVDADTGRGATMVQMFAEGYKVGGQRPVALVREFHDAMLKRLKAAGGSLDTTPK